MKVIRKHVPLIITVAVLLFILIMALQLRESKEDGTFKLLDLEGNRTALEEFVVNGELKDGYHRTEFSIRSGEVTTETEVYGQPAYRVPDWYARGFITLLDGEQYEVWNYQNYAEITHRDWVDSSKNSYARVDYSGLYSGQRSYTNPIEYGLAKVKDQIFFTVPTSKEFTGTNGIYAVKFSDDNRRTEESNMIVEIPLDQNKQKDAPALEVMGLESVGDQLALLLMEGEELVVQSYTTDGKLLGEGRIPFKARLTATSSETVRYDMRYEAFSDPDQHTLILGFRSYGPEQDEAVMTWMTFDISNGADGMEPVEVRYSEGNIDHNDLTYAREIDGKFIVIQTVSVDQEDIHMAIYHKRLLVHVFEAGQLVYKGELQTDVNDDLIRVIHRRDSYGYGNQDHRYFDKIEITRRREAQ